MKGDGIQKLIHTYLRLYLSHVGSLKDSSIYALAKRKERKKEKN